MDLRHIISTQQFLDLALLEELFASAKLLEQQDKEKTIPKVLSDKILATVFYEPSTRTRFSFEAAMLKLGGGVITTESASHFSSATKGESLSDSIKILGGYADAIVLRHPEKGSAQVAAEVSSVPVINAGDGAGEHPTQALLDIYTIQKERGSIAGLKVVLLGDLLYGRTIHSLLPLLAVYQNVHICLISPPELRLPDQYKSYLSERGVTVEESETLDGIIETADVLYVTRVQKERFPSVEAYEKVKNAFVIDRAMIDRMKKEAIIMHPLPRVTEINPEIDNDPRAAYFRQAKNGMYMRMALLSKILS